MAAASSDGDGEEAAARWRRFAELGTEAALREVGCSEELIADTLRCLKMEAGRSQHLSLIYLLGNLSITQDGVAVVLATIGRGISAGMRSLLLQVGYEQQRTTPYPRDVDEATALCVNLSSNSNIEEVNFSNNMVFGSHEGFPLLATLLKNNSAIRDLKLSACNIKLEALRSLLDGLKANSTLTSLDLSITELQDEGIENIAAFLTTNDSLKCINLSSSMVGHGSIYSGLSALASSLEHNTTLEELRMGDTSFRSNDMKTLLRPLCGRIGDRASLSKNTTLKILDLYNVTNVIGTLNDPGLVEPIALMIRTNRSLSTLRIGGMWLEPEEWAGQIFAALKENETLEELDLKDCRGISEDAANVLMNLLQFSSTGLTRINLQGSGANSRQGQVDEEIRMNLQYRGQLRGQARVQTSSGRLVLCGYEFAGKTAIRKTMQYIERGTPCALRLSMGWKTALEAAPGLRRFLFGRDAHRELTARTRGFDVLILQKQEYLASVWDFAGQREYYALHDYLFPNVINSCFLYVCSCRCPPDLQNPRGKLKDKSSIREECEYWMRFIASNSKPRQVGDGFGPQLPHVRFVLTHKDTLDVDTLNLATQYAEDVVGELRNLFQDVIALCEIVEVVNAHSPEDVERLIALTNDTLKEILEHQTEYAVCKEVRSSMEARLTKEPSKPVLSLEDFGEICRNQVGPLAPIPFKDAHLHSNEGREAVLSYLNDTGDIIFPKGLDFIVGNPRWFGVGVLGSLVDALGGSDELGQEGVSMCTGVLTRPKHFWKVNHTEGFVERKNINSLLKHSLQTMNLNQIIPADKLIQLMIHLELCFEKEPGKVDSSLFIPALFDDETESAAKGRRKLEWKLARVGPLHYLGRRLECENKAITFLTPGFFPRLQVHLRNYIHKRNWTGNTGFKVGRNLICFAENGVEVLVEYSGDIDYFVDILVRSSKPHTVALKFIEEHVVKKIVQFCASPQGCQGVLLVEAVIRPICVQDLQLCVDRKPHSVLVSFLKARIAEDDGYEHTWSHKIEDIRDTDFACDLLEGDGSHKTVLAESQDNLLQSSGSRTSTSTHSDEWLLTVERQLPKLFYPSIEDVGWLRKLDQWLNVAKVMPIKLHLMCDHKEGSHKVEDQPGRIMRLKWKPDGYDLPLAKFALTLLWASVGGVTSMVGVPVKYPLVDKWILDLFNVGGMPDINAETLHQLMNGSKTGTPVSEQEILKVLERYMKIEPHTDGLKNILNLQDGDKFWDDFRIRKVAYIEASPYRIGWVCERHYKSGLQQRILKSLPLT